MKKAYKALSIIIVAMMVLFACSNVFAANTAGGIGSIAIDNIGRDEDLGEADSAMETIGSTVFTIVTNAGIILSVVIIAILGVKYMMGSTEEKSEYKKSMMPYLVGAILVFGASTIGKMVMNFGTSL